MFDCNHPGDILGERAIATLIEQFDRLLEGATVASCAEFFNNQATCEVLAHGWATSTAAHARHCIGDGIREGTMVLLRSLRMMLFAIL